MADPQRSKRSHRWQNATVRRRHRAVGCGASAGAVVAFGISPLACVPAAHADEFDLIIDSVINAISGSVAGVADASTGLDPTVALESLAGLDPAAGLPGLDLSSLDLATSTLSAANAELTTNSSLSVSIPDSALTAASDSSTAATTLDSLVHSLEQDWITSPLGTDVDQDINSLWHDIGGSGLLIGNGASGVPGSTLAAANGGAGGLLFGDGGNGATDAAGQGGAGGAAGLFGDGGTGGIGADGVAGGNGGDGGAGGTLIGDGGVGGTGGDGSDPDSLPALGGAGGTGGLLGHHGAVGDYGRLTGVASGSGTTPIETIGNWLTNSDGQVVILHGLNEVYKQTPYEPVADGFGNDDAAFLAANGFNVARVGVIWSELEPEPGVFNTAYLESIQQTVQTLANNGVYSILDFHQDAYSTVFGGEGAPAWAVQTDGLPNPQLPFPFNEFFDPAETQAWDSFWGNAEAPNGVGLEDNYAQMLEYVANAFNGNPDVVGFEIMNEPSAGSQTVSTLFGSPFFDAQELTPFYDQAASAIRAVDPTTPIFYEPNVLFDAGVPTHLGTVDATGTVFSFHDYCEIDLGFLGCLPSPTAIADNAESYAQAHGIPAFMSEFGASSDQTGISASMQAANQNLMGWTEWAYSGQGDITTTASPPSSESLVYNPQLPPVGSNVNTANLETLAEPYPQVISGTPNSWSFNNGTFQFSYSTEKVDGLGSFPAGSQTTISVPAVEFPNGYQVSVTGGEVVSAPNAAELVIASNAGANAVNVVVSPAAAG